MMPRRLLKKFLLWLMAALILAVSITFWSATQATTKFFYTVTELNSLGGSRNGAYDINDLGQIVGYSENVTGQQRSVLWNNNGKIDADWTGNGGFNYAASINNVGQVACSTDLMSHVSGRCPYLWEDGNITYIGQCGGTGYVTAINDVGQVAGWDTNYPFVWKDGVTTPLSEIDSNIGANQALDINNRGQIVGYSLTSKKILKTHAVLWQNGKLKVLAKLPGGNNSVAMGINKHGQVVGWSDSLGSTKQAVLWENGTIKNLGTFDGNATKATDISARGTVVGYSFTIDFKENPQHAFVWKNGIMRDLNKLLPANSGWELNSAQAINNRGQIVGEGKFNGQQRAYLLTPTWVTN